MQVQANQHAINSTCTFCSCLMSSRHVKTKSFNIERICDVTTQIYCAKKFKIEFKFESIAFACLRLYFLFVTELHG